MSHPRIGSSFEEFLAAEGIADEVRAAAVKRVLSWQIDESRKSQGLSKSALAKRMNTSRSQVERLLDPTNTHVKLDTLERAATALDRRLVVELV